MRCGLDFLSKKPARGPSPTICQKRACRRGKPRPTESHCLICRVLLPVQSSGRPRLFCGDDCASVARLDKEWQDAFISESDWFTIDKVGYLEDSWHKAAPAKRAFIGKVLNGAVDFDWREYLVDGEKPEWLALFMEEFGSSGVEVGQTFPGVGRTLG
jgi:hypothetical protein